MITLLAIGTDINVLFFGLIGLAAGIVSGFVGVGGGYMVTPALVVLGFPGYAAAGTDIAHITGKSVVAAIRHRQLGNVDIKLGAVMILGTVVGVELGVQSINVCKAHGVSSELILSCFIALCTLVGALTFCETRKAKRRIEEMKAAGAKVPRDMYLGGIARKIQSISVPPMIYFPKSRIRLSLCVVLTAGFLTGLVSGFFGVGGGVIRLPVLIYLMGLPSIIAVGTDLFEIIISSGYGLIRHSMSGNVVIEAAVLMILGASVGAQIGTLATRYVRGISVRYILAYSVFFSAAGSLLKLVYMLTEESLSWLQTGAIVLTLGGMGVLMLMIVGLFVFGIMHNRGRHVPHWMDAFLVKLD